MLAEPYGAPEIGADAGLRTRRRVERVVGQERRQVLAHADRADARATATVGDAERLVQVEVGDVGAELARPGHPHERVEVGAVDVDLAPGVVDHRAEVGDRVLEDAVRRGVGDHDRRERVAVLLDLGREVVHVDVAGDRVGLDDDDLAARP